MKCIFVLAVVTALLVAILPSLEPTGIVDAQACRQMRPRREFRMLSQQERATFISAIRQLQSGPSPTQYDKYTATHWSIRSYVHGYAQFFPWHRLYILEFERSLQAINPNIMLPYWDWSYDSQAPELSPIFSSAFMGSNGGNDGCVQSGPFANWYPAYPSRKCLERSFNRGGRLSAFYAPEQLVAILRNSDGYNQMRVMLESPPHGIVHTNIGGDLATMYSPNDPIFFLHHAFVDKLWDEWQRGGDGSNFWSYEGPNSDGSLARSSDVLWPYRLRVNDVMDSRRFCYFYEPFITSRILMSSDLINNNVINTNSPAFNPGRFDDDDDDEDSDEVARARWQRIVARANTTTSSRPTSTLLVVPSNDRSELVALRAPQPLPAAWLRMNNHNVSQTRAIEHQLRQVVDRVNRLEHYVSSAALVRHDGMLTALSNSSHSQQQTSPLSMFTATVAGKQRRIVTMVKPIQAALGNQVGAKAAPTTPWNPSALFSAIRSQVEAMTGVTLANDLVSVTPELQKATTMNVKNIIPPKAGANAQAGK